MDVPEDQNVTRILERASRGDDSAIRRLMPLVYGELRALAESYLKQERSDHTLQATALVHEAYVRLIKQEDVDWQNRAHFFGLAAQAIRRILVDHARHHNRAKRGGGLRQVTGVLDLACDEKIADALALDELISRLEKEDAKIAAVVRLRFYAGLSIRETAQALGVSERTIKRDWAYARTWLADAWQCENPS